MGFSLDDYAKKKKQETQKKNGGFSLDEYARQKNGGVKAEEESADSALSSPATVREKETVAPLSGGKKFMPTDIVGKNQMGGENPYQKMVQEVGQSIQAGGGMDALLKAVAAQEAQEQSELERKIGMAEQNLQNSRQDVLGAMTDEYLAASRGRGFGFLTDPTKRTEEAAGAYQKDVQDLLDIYADARLQSRADLAKAEAEQEMQMRIAADESWRPKSAVESMRQNAREMQKADWSGTNLAHVAPYLMNEVAQGAAGQVWNAGNLITQPLADLFTKGEASNSMQKIQTYLNENPEAHNTLLDYYLEGTPGRDGVLMMMAERAGVNNRDMNAYVQNNLANLDRAKMQSTLEISEGVRNLGDMAYSVGQQIPSIMLTAAGGSPAVTKAISSALMGMSSAGAKLQQNAQQYGFDWLNYANAVATGLTEFATEALGNTPTLEAISGMTFGQNSIGEMMEELIGYPVGQIVDWLTLKDGWRGGTNLKDIFDMNEWLKAGVSGLAVGGVLGSFGKVANIAGRAMDGKISAQQAATELNKTVATLPDGTTIDALDPRVAKMEDVRKYSERILDSIVAQIEQVKAQPKKGAEVATEMGIGKHGAEAAEKAGITPENVGAFTAYWRAGAEGRPIEAVTTNQSGIDELTKEQAYLSGKMDATEEGVAVREWTTYNKEQEAERNGTGENALREGGERYDGENPVQPVRQLEEGAGRDPGRNVQNGQTESRVVDLEYSAEKVNSKQAGLEDGLEDDGIYLIKGGTSQDYLDAEAEAKRLGLEFVPFAGGDIHTLDAPDGARGCVVNGKMYVRMDDPEFTGRQIALHEGGHELIRQGAIDVDQVLGAVARKMGDSFVADLTYKYLRAYAGTTMTNEQIQQEIVCDARGEMNIFRVYGEIAQNSIDLADKVLPAIREEAAKGGGTRAGPEGAQYSRRAQRGRTIELETMENNRFERLRSKRDSLPKEWFAYTKDFFYIYSNHSFMEYSILAKISITEANRDAIAQFEEDVENGAYSDARVYDSWVQNFRRGKGRYSWTSVDAGQHRTAARHDGMDGRERGSKDAGNSQSGGKNPQQDAAVSKVGVEIDAKTESAAPGAYSRRTWLKSQYATDKAAAAKALSQQLDVSLEQAEQYIDNVNSVAKMIADDEVRLDYEAAPGMSSFVGNTEYGGSIDFSTICKKRRLLTGTFEAIQKALPNTALTAEEILTIRKMMADRGYEVSCGLCYVEGSRANMGQYTKQFLDEYAKTNPKYLPNMAEMNTASGQEKIRIQHPEVYAAYEKFMNELAQRKPKMYQMATEYKGEILDKFMTKKGKPKWTVSRKNLHGGLRMQSFSDFEIIHLIDSMQVIMDMSQVGLAGQAYTKVPDFAAALGDTGLKINLSLIAKGVDAKGKLVLDEVEGMARADAEKLRNQYSDNVGTIIVVFTDVQLQAAMNDPFIDYIIPFHRSQWKSSQYEQMGIPKNAKDFTSWQNESYIEPVYSKSGKKQRPKNYAPNSYWDFSKSGTENAKTYLQMCHENNRRPKFHYLLDKNADGSYRLKKDGSTDGYWKLLIDFKMYNNEGVGVEQAPVKPEFNMTEAERMLRDYQGGHETFPAARDVVDEFVEAYKAEHEGPYSRRLNPEDVRAALDVYTEQYGAIEPGENPFREIQVPRKTGENENVSKTVRTILEAKATPEAAIPTIEQMVANGDFSYETITDKQAIADAQGKLTSKGWSKTLSKWLDEAKNGTVSKDHTVTGWALYNNAANAGDLDTAMTVLEKMVLSQRNAAQALQATRVLKKLSPEAQLYAAQRSVEDLQEELNERYGAKNAPEIKIEPTLAEAFMTAKTDKARDAAMAEIYKDVGKQMPSTFRDKWNAWRYLAMLGNPRTHVRNIVGNAGFAPIVATKNLTATAIEKAVNAVTGGKTGRSKAVIGTSAKDKALLSAAWADYDNVQDEIMAGGKYSDFQVARQNIEEGRRIFKNRVLEAARRGNSRAMEAEDAWFSKPHYAYALAGYCKANGITPEMVTDGKAIQTARAYAIREAQKATYRDTNYFSQTISGLGKYDNIKNPVGKGLSIVLQGILPFRKTPANILVRGVEYSPIGLVKTIALDSAKVKRGDMTATEMIDNLSAGLTGTGLLALGAFLAAQGLIRGHGPEDDKKEFEELQGHQAYSLEVGGTSITLDWLAPECLPFFVGVNLYEQSQATGEELTMSTILSAITNVSEPMLEMSCLQSLNDVFDAVGYASSNDLSSGMSALASAATSYLTQALPTIFGQAERTGQDVRYTTYTTKDAFLTRDMQYAIGSASAKIPGWDYNQIPYIDAWGRREDTGGLAARAFGNFANPSYTSNITGSEMEDELMRVYDETGEASVFPTRAQRSFPVDGEQYYLTADEYVRYATTKGETSYQLVSDLVDMNIYDRMSEEDKVDAISDAYSLANVVAKYEVSDYETTGWMAKAVAAKKIGIDYSKYLEVRLTVKDIESIKDSDGDSVSNSKGLQVMEAIYKIPGLNDKQRRQLFEDFGVGKSIIDLNKAAVEAKLKTMR